MTKRRRLEALEARLKTIEQLVDKIDRSLERIEIITVVREPNTALAADAYNGLRKQVIAAVGERTSHLHQLAKFDGALRTDADLDGLRSLVREWMSQASLEVVEDPSVDAFERVGPEDAASTRVLRPAYVDAITGRVVQGGLVERVAEASSPTPDQAPPEADEEAPTGGEE
jgi:hypothetical protein